MLAVFVPTAAEEIKKYIYTVFCAYISSVVRVLCVRDGHRIVACQLHARDV